MIFRTRLYFPSGSERSDTDAVAINGHVTLNALKWASVHATDIS